GFMMKRLFLSVTVLILATPNGFAQDDEPVGKKGEPTPDGLKALKNVDPVVRYKAAALLVKLGPIAKFAVPELREALKDDNGFVRVKVAEALWSVEKTSPTILLPVLLGALKDKNAELRAVVPPVLAQMGSRAKTAVPALVKALKDKEVSVRIEVVAA